MHFQGKYSYWRTLPHIQKRRRPLFVTFSTDKRWKLPEGVRGIVLEACLHQHNKKIELHAGVVMPDHAHILFTPLVSADERIFSLPEIMHAIKGRAAHGINVALGRKGAVWQVEFFDHVLRSNESVSQKVDYISENPVRAGLVKEGQDYPWLWLGTVPVL